MSGELTIGKGEFLTLICALFFALQIIYTGKFSKELSKNLKKTILASKAYAF